MNLSVLESLNGALHQAMADDPSVIVLGEDLLDPYGGAFKVTRGLSSRFPTRVYTTPISEAGFVGIAAGMAMRGLRPVVEIMFGDFLMLAADQIVNHISKYRWMYNEQVHVPLVIRTPMGGRRGYGPTHSQTLEKHFLGVPGLEVVAPSPFHDPGTLLRSAIADERPVLFIENKVMYARSVRETATGRVGDLYARSTADRYPTLLLSYEPFTSADVTLVAYGGMAEIAVEAAEHLFMEEELVCEVVIPSFLNLFDVGPVLHSLGRSGRLVVMEEGQSSAGWAAEVISRVVTRNMDMLQAAPVRVTAEPFPIANTRALEEAILPQVADVVSAVGRAVRHGSSRTRTVPI